jgi:hypothetical protein
MNKLRTLICVLLLTGPVAGCADPASGRAAVARRDTSQFEHEVWPVLMRDCGFHACHGSPDRFFRVFGIGRARLFPEDEQLPNSGQIKAMSNHVALERDYTLQFALAMIDPVDPSQSLLLRKPLAIEAGGSGHFGMDKFGRNVYRTTDSAGYLTLARWVLSVADQAPPASTPTMPAAGSAAPATPPADPFATPPSSGGATPVSP